MLGGDWTDGTMTDFKWRHFQGDVILWAVRRSEEHTSELQSLMRISYAVFCLKKKKNNTKTHKTDTTRHTPPNPTMQITNEQSTLITHSTQHNQTTHEHK